MFHNEPTIETLNAMGLAVVSVGNDEFDKGHDEIWPAARRRLLLESFAILPRLVGQCLTRLPR